MTAVDEMFAWECAGAMAFELDDNAAATLSERASAAAIDAAAK